MKKNFFLIAALCLFGCGRALCDGETIDEKQLLAGRSTAERQMSSRPCIMKSH